MPTRKAKIVSKSIKPRAPIAERGGIPIFKGEGDITILCGNGDCGALLASNMDRGKLAGVFVTCHRCGCKNDLTEACA